MNTVAYESSTAALRRSPAVTDLDDPATATATARTPTDGPPTRPVTTTAPVTVTARVITRLSSAVLIGDRAAILRQAAVVLRILL